MSCSTTKSDFDSSDTRELLIVYATETGNARDAADFIARQCRRIAFRCRVVDVESISLVGYSLSVPVILLTHNSLIYSQKTWSFL